MKRPLCPAPALTMTDGEKRAQRRQTWKLLLLGVVTNFVGCGVHYLVIAPPRLAGAMPAPRLTTPPPSFDLTKVGKP